MLDFMLGESTSVCISRLWTVLIFRLPLFWASEPGPSLHPKLHRNAVTFPCVTGY